MLNIKNYIRGYYYLHSEGGGITFLSWKDFAKDWLNFDVTKREKKTAVYLFGNFYIGASSDLRKRLYQHCKKALNNHHDNQKFSDEFNKLINNGKKISIEILSENLNDELFYINKYKKTIINSKLRGYYKVN